MNDELSCGGYQGAAAGRASIQRLLGGVRRTALGLVAAGVIAAPALAQQEPPREPIADPMDLNETPAVQPAAPAAGDQPAAAVDPVAPVEEDGEIYRVARFVLEYHTPHPAHPPIDDLLDTEVRLGVLPNGYVAPRAGVPTTVVRIGDVVEAGGADFYRSGINQVGRALVSELNDRGLIGIFVQLNPEDIDEITGEDLREADRQDMRLVVWTGIVADVRTIASGSRLARKNEAGERVIEQTVNNPDAVHARIREQSPVQPGGLVRRDQMDDFMFRLNRHPGRRVDAALAPGEEPGEVVLDYLISESKPWTIYAQLSNTGTEATGEWRQRFGFTHNQLTKHDDILRLDYVTSGFEDSHAVTASYEFPLRSDRLRARVFGSYSEFEASDIGFANEEFSGNTWNLGGEVLATIYQQGELFVDAVGGVRWQKVSTTNELLGTEGDTNFLLPYVGLRAERFTDATSTLAGITFEANWGDLAGTDEDEIQNLGRLDVDEDWVVMRYYADHSFYLEPVFNPGGYREGASGGPQTLAHELAGSIRGQYAFGSRLIPNEEDVAGGFYSVRGYDESIAAGDNSVIVSLEYRFHLPRVFKPSRPGTLNDRSVGVFGDSFRWTPQQPFGRADWDLILKAFTDIAHIESNDAAVGEEDQTLWGAGIGAELQVRQNLSVRLEWGFALEEVDGANETDVGDNRVHFSATLLY